MSRVALVLLIAAAVTVAPAAQPQGAGAPQPGRGQDVPSRARGADAIVVAKVTAVISDFQTNAYGDRLIVSHAELTVEEALKGTPPQVMSLDVEGGTVGNLTLTVSDMPSIAPGERGLFFLHQSHPGVHVPHDRGHGILKLDRADRDKESGLTLGELKQQIQQGLK
jgi:hypothetical protein